MTDQNQAIREDIAFMRGLAEAGLQTENKGGSILAASGLIFGTASLTCWWALVLGQVRSGAFYSVVWFGAAALFVLALFILRRDMSPKAGASKAAGMIWGGAGYASFIIIVSLILISVRTNLGWIMGVISPVILGTYGGCWVVASSLSGKGWLKWIGHGSAVMALVCAWFIQEPATQFLIYGLSLFALMAAPGLILARQARQAV